MVREHEQLLKLLQLLESQVLEARRGLEVQFQGIWVPGFAAPIECVPSIDGRQGWGEMTPSVQANGVYVVMGDKAKL